MACCCRFESLNVFCLYKRAKALFQRTHLTIDINSAAAFLTVCCRAVTNHDANVSGGSHRVEIR